MNFENARYRILLVEDELFVGLDIAEALEANGFTVHGPVTDIESAEKIAGQMTFNAAVLDYRIRGGNTGDLSNRLAALGVPILFITGMTDLLKKEQLDQTRVVLEKPFRSRDLLAAVKRLIDTAPALSGPASLQPSVPM